MICCFYWYVVYTWYVTGISMTYDISHMVCDTNGCLLKTFGCLEWESELYRSMMLDRCYHDLSPFNCSTCEARGIAFTT